MNSKKNNLDNLNNRQNQQNYLNRKHLLLIEIGFFIFVIFFLIFSFLHFDKKATECLNDPIPYAIRQLEKANGEMVTCSCSSAMIQGNLIFDNSGVIVQDFGNPLFPQGLNITSDNPE